MNAITSIKDKLKNQNDISIVFIHGIAATYYDWIKAVKKLAGNNYFKMRYTSEKLFKHNFNPDSNTSIWTISYYSHDVFKESFFGDLTEYANRVEKMITMIKELTGRKKIVLITHSMGGLVARKYMTLSDDNWNSTHKILTVGTPNEGVTTSIGIVGQLIDIKTNSKFITRLDKDWKERYGTKKWGVIGAVDRHLIFNFLLRRHNQVDSAGPGYVAISSSIPFGEWKDALDNIEKPFFDTENFGFRIAVNSNHWKIMNCNATYEGINWALEKSQ